MARKCIVCKKELPEGSRLPVCEYHKGIATENAKKAAIGAASIVLTAGIAAKDTVVPVVKTKALPAVTKAIKLMTRQ